LAPRPVDPREADRAARLAAQREFSRPLVLEAGAGTGKTTTLVARILSWCLGPGWERAREGLLRPGRPARRSPLPSKPAEPTVEHVAAEVLRKVVAITFTEAAAAEMADRVAEDLARVAGGFGEVPGWLDPGLLPGEAERVVRARALVGTLDHLAVRTIHAFCRGLLATYPLEAGRHPSLTVDADGRLLETIAREAVESRLREGYGDPGDPDLLALAARGFGPPELLEALLTLAGAGLPAVVLATDPFAGPALAALGRRLAAAAAGLQEILAGSSGGASSGRARRGNLPAIESGLGLLLGRLNAADDDEDAALPDLAILQAWVTELLPGNLAEHIRGWSKGKLSSQAEQERLGGVVGDLAGRAAGLCRLLSHLEKLDPELLGAARRALGPLLGRIEAELRSRGIETFQSLLSGAAALLARHPEVRSRVRRGIDQLLVDEFQDTDREQCEILRLLALDGAADERPGLFLVGDPKQSIYGWRSADLRAYDGFVDLVRRDGGLVLPLVENFRSVPAILEEVARVIQPVMRHTPGLQPPFEPLLPCEAKAEKPGFHEEGPGGRPRRPVEYWVSWKGEGDPGEILSRTRPAAAAELEAAALAADLLDLHTAHGVRFKEIGILLRSNTDLDTYLEALRRARIPFLVGRDKQYYRRREVIEVAALVRAVLDPGDHLALLTVLRSASVGVPDAALLPLWSRDFPRLATELLRPAPQRLAAISAVIREAAGAVPRGVPGIAPLRGWEENVVAAMEALAYLRESWETDPADVFVERLRRLFLVEATEAARYLGAYRLANLDRFFRQLLGALEEGSGDVTAVLRVLRRSVAESEEAEEGRPREGGEDAVSVLTIHGAKGLDFEHVYLLQLHKQSRLDRPDRTEIGALPPATASGSREERRTAEYRVFGAATPGFDEVEAERAAVEAAERIRTLYVAMTRAKDRLVLAGTWPPRETPLDPAQARTHVDLLLSRPGVPHLASLFQEAAERGTWSSTDATGALWYLPDLHERETAPEGEREAPELPSPEEVRRAATLLVTRGEEAEARMARPWSAAASEEAHHRLRALQAEHRFESEGEDGEASAPTAATEAADATADREDLREAAMAAGGAVHRALESWDLAAEPREELARQRALLPSYLAALLGDAQPDRAERRAAALLDRFAAGPLLPRLRAIGDEVIARELPVLLPPGPGESSPVGYVAGAIDLLYRDVATGALVIADFKTDDVHEEGSLAARAAAYAPQGAAYVRAVAEALGLAEPPRFELWFLAAGRVMP
jgi:ATP-dependent helicase/nuclease subunit A